VRLLPFRRTPEERADAGISVDELISYFNFNGHLYGLSGVQQTLQNGREPISGGFEGLSSGAYKANGVVFSCVLARMLLFSEARFQFQQLSNGRPGNLFGDVDLSVLERPWPGATTGDLLTRAEQFVSIAGNAFMARPYRRVDGRVTTVREDRILMLRPDWTTIVAASARLPDQPGWAEDAEVIGYVYSPGGRNSGAAPIMYDRDEVAHYAPIPDPDARWRGMSWLTPLIREIEADSAATRHKLKFFENGATPNHAVLTKISDPEKFRTFVEAFRKGNEGLANAYKTMILSEGADVKLMGADLRQLEFKVTQGAGETRIAAAAGVPPVIVGLSEGLQAATYSNYGQARRRFADGTMRPLWRNIAGSLETIVPPPASGARLWYDDRDIAFLKEDRKDDAEIQQANAIAIKTLTDAGYEAASVVDAVTSGDLTRLKHTGLFSVQLQPPGSNDQKPARNGKQNGRQLVLQIVDHDEAAS
jgi:phage portal protein BeeE